MGLIRWGDFLETGHAEMDRQHRELVEAFNQVYAACAAGLPSAGACFRELLERTEAHYQWEEGLMKRHRFQGVHEHQASHQATLGRIAPILADCPQTGSLAVMKWLEATQDLFVRQTLLEDQVLAHFLLKLPVEPDPAWTPEGA